MNQNKTAVFVEFTLSTYFLLLAVLFAFCAVAKLRKRHDKQRSSRPTTF